MSLVNQLLWVWWIIFWKWINQECRFYFQKMIWINQSTAKWRTSFAWRSWGFRCKHVSSAFFSAWNSPATGLELFGCHGVFFSQKKGTMRKELEDTMGIITKFDFDVKKILQNSDIWWAILMTCVIILYNHISIYFCYVYKLKTKKHKQKHGKLDT